MDIKLVILLALFLAGITMLVAVGKKSFKRKGALNVIFLIFGLVLVGYSIVGAGSQFGWYTLPTQAGQFFLAASTPSYVYQPINTGSAGSGGAINTGSIVTYQPTATYTSVDKYAATTTVSGTSYYKVNSNKATTTAQTNVNTGDSLTFWVDNSTYFVKPAVVTAGAGVTPVTAEAYANGTTSITLYDLVGRNSVKDATTTNISMSANDQANVEISYQGTSKQSAAPFGGVFVVEYNSSISSVTCTGDDLLDSNPFHLTYTVTATSNTYKTWAFGPSLDDGSGKVRKITCQFNNGASPAGVGAAYYFKFIPANYYVSINGDILLDTEKAADGTTTRTGSRNQPMAISYWAA